MILNWHFENVPRNQFELFFSETKWMAQSYFFKSVYVRMRLKKERRYLLSVKKRDYEVKSLEDTDQHIRWYP